MARNQGIPYAYQATDAINNTMTPKAAAVMRINMSEPKLKASVQAGAPNRFRRLKSSELVTLGDFVLDEFQGFEPWEGPSGFRADAFVKAIYRRRRAVRR